MDPRIATLIANRSLSTRAQVTAFDHAMVALDAQGDAAAHLDALHLVFIDDSDDPEVMWGLVHLIEDCELDAQLASLFRVLPALAEQAPEWVMILHYRIIGNDAARARYPELLRAAPAPTVAAARAILEVIAEDPEPALRDGARALLAAI